MLDGVRGRKRQNYYIFNIWPLSVTLTFEIRLWSQTALTGCWARGLLGNGHHRNISAHLSGDLDRWHISSFPYRQPFFNCWVEGLLVWLYYDDVVSFSGTSCWQIELWSVMVKTCKCLHIWSSVCCFSCLFYLCC